MGFISAGEKLLHEEVSAVLLPGEAVIRSGIGTRQLKFRMMNVNVALTNLRLLTDVNKKTVQAARVASAAGGGLGGGSGGGITGAVSGAIGGIIGANIVTSLKAGTIALGDITDIRKAKYKLFGFIPTRDIAIEFDIASGESLILLFNSRNEWFDDIEAARQAILPTTASN